MERSRIWATNCDFLMYLGRTSKTVYNSPTVFPTDWEDCITWSVASQRRFTALHWARVLSAKTFPYWLSETWTVKAWLFYLLECTLGRLFLPLSWRGLFDSCWEITISVSYCGLIFFSRLCRCWILTEWWKATTAFRGTVATSIENGEAVSPTTNHRSIWCGSCCVLWKNRRKSACTLTSTDTLESGMCSFMVVAKREIQSMWSPGRFPTLWGRFMMLSNTRTAVLVCSGIRKARHASLLGGNWK